MRVLDVRFGIGDPKHDGEGRAITVEYEKVPTKSRTGKNLNFS